VSIIRLKGAQASVNATPSSFSNASLLYVYNGGTVATISVVSSANVAVGSMTVGASKDVLLEKAPTDVISSNTASGVVATPVAYRN